MKSAAAQAASIIRKYIKMMGIKASVRSSVYSMGSSIDIFLKEDIEETDMDALEAFVSPYSYDKGCDMSDNRISRFNDNVPQVSFVFINLRVL